ncbi:MAG: SLATT domain-containing protein [Pseudomonadota bacterium]
MVQRSSSSDVRDNVSTLAQHEAFARIRERHIGNSRNEAHFGSGIAATPEQLESLSQERDTIVRNCRVMKSALFNAGKRLERKKAAGQFTFALSGMYGFLVPLFTLQFEPFLTALVTYVVSFTAATAGAVSFVVAMIYQQQDLARRARRFYEAGRQINKLGKDIKITQFGDADALRRCTHHYDEILASAENHDEIDYEFAILGYRPRDNKNGRLDRWVSNRRRLDIRFALQTYGMLFTVWLLPPLIGFTIWLALSK